MKIELESFAVATSPSIGGILPNFKSSSAHLRISGVGEVSIKTTIPDEIFNQIEEFYKAEFLKNIAKEIKA